MRYLVTILIITGALMINSCKKETTIRVKNNIPIQTSSQSINGTLYGVKVMLYDKYNHLQGEIEVGDIDPEGGTSNSYVLNDIVQKARIVFRYQIEDYYSTPNYITVYNFDIIPESDNEILINDSTPIMIYNK